MRRTPRLMAPARLAAFTLLFLGLAPDTLVAQPPPEPVGVFVNANTNAIQFIDPSNAQVSVPRLGGQLGGVGTTIYDVAITPDGKTAIVSNFEAKRLYFIDIAGGFSVVPTILGTTQVGAFAEDIVISPDGKYAIVTGGGDNRTISVVSIATRTLVQDFVYPARRAQAVTITPNGRTVLTVDYDGYVHIYSFDLATGLLAYVSEIRLNDPASWPSGVQIPADWNGVVLPFRPVNIAVSPDGQTVFVTDGHHNQAAILVQRGPSDYPLRQFTAPGNYPRAPEASGIVEHRSQTVVFSKDGRAAYTIITTPSTYTKVHEIDIGDSHLAVPTDRAATITPTRGTSQLFGVDTIAIDPTDGYLYVANPTVSGGATSISIIDLEAHAEVIVRQAQGIPTGIAFSTLAEGDAAINVNPKTLHFTTTAGGPTPPPQAMTIENTGLGSLNWSILHSVQWTSSTPSSGTGASTVTVSVNPTGLPVGTHSGRVTISGSAANTPQTVTVSLNILPAGTSTPPFGLIDTPLQDTTDVTGTIGVTGWVLDDIGVVYVRVYRDCLPFEPAINCAPVAGRNVVYVGDATFVEGARPDVQGIYPTYPNAGRAGWGYLLLTNMLPHVPTQQMFGGQGTIVLHALATDVEGHQKWLGRTVDDTNPTTVTLTNDTIVKPFGAIDTPGQGATVNGPYANFGWVLTPDTNTTGGDPDDRVIPVDGSTVRLYIDGVAVRTLSFNQCRGTTAGAMLPDSFCDDDVSSIFGHLVPQPTYTPRTSNPTKFRNLDRGRGPIGATVLDTTWYSNGMHTIMWGVADTAGNNDGIGSRYFSIQNAGGDVAGPATRTAPIDVSRFPTSTSQVWGRTGLDDEAPWVEMVPDAEGVRRIRIPDLGRIEVWLGEGTSAGYHMVQGVATDLPVGSHLDRARGVFSWAPGVGFVGTYRLVFLRNGGRVPVDVTIRPLVPIPGGESPVRMAVDVPRSGATVTGAVRIAGWALDPQAAIGSGVIAVHVWGTRVDAAGPVAPVFLGAAALGGPRADIVSAYGPQFGAAAFDLTAGGLAPGTYDITTYVRLARTRRWEDARTVRVTVR